MKRRDLERHLRGEGCRSLVEGGKHSKWVGPTGELTTIPRHREVDYLLAVKICRDLAVERPSGPR